MLYGEIEIGSERLLEKGTITPAHLVRWCGASENWHRIHYDHLFAVEHEGLPGVLVNGSWKQHVLVQLVNDWLGDRGWLYRIKFRYVAMDLAGTTITARAVVSDKQETQGFGMVTLDISIINGDGIISTEGKALVAVPIGPNDSIPYPFPEISALKGVEL